jgi:N-acetylmuramoyl-L-alanine amidase
MFFYIPLLFLLLDIPKTAVPQMNPERFSVCIDPGHPSEVGSGATGKHISELKGVWILGVELEKELKRSGVRVVMTKSREDQYVSNVDRAKIANDNKVDLMVRLHMDAASDRGLATFYPAKQGRIGKMVGPSTDVIKQSAIAAKSFHSTVTSLLTGVLRNRGLRTDGQTAVGSRYGALTGSIYRKGPVILVEVLTITNPEDEKVFESVRDRQMIVKALHSGVLDALIKLRATSHKEVRTPERKPKPPTIKNKSAKATMVPG